ncbi:MATE family efflux transporter [Clostridium taeniosporum]|uniref:Probable multidrug resistance protein NorM n=1 Tax=Clostridium taeniosporum TaxID=394958 RepID=A0A1D7XL85_9CLOT|nr:MATE family efflux transporter [Clostridium taeniosporum]AOR24096.1 MATE family efflux transporter [Clostridium taeniosporum]
MVRDMTKGKPGKIVLLFAIPMVIGNIFQQVYNIVDSVIVGNFIGANALAAVGASYPMAFLFITIATGASIGCSVIISQMFGAKQIGDMKTAIYTSIISITIFSTILMILGITTSNSVLQILKTPEEILTDADNYMKIYMIGVVFLFVYNINTGVFNALGNSKIPLYFLIFSSILNVVLDFLFVVKFKSGVVGAAYATLIAQGISAMASLTYLLIKLKRIKDDDIYRIFDIYILKKICKIAIPSIIQQAIVSIGNLFVQVLVNTYGVVTIAAYTSATRIDSIIIMPMVNISSAVSTFTAQNIGAGLIERVKNGYKAALKMIGIFCFIIAILLHEYAENVIGIFIDSDINKEAINIGIQYITVVSVFYVLMGIMITTNGVLRGAGDIKVFMISTLCNLSLRVIAAYVLSYFIGSKAIWWAIPLGWILASTISVLRYRSGKWKMGKLV